MTDVLQFIYEFLYICICILIQKCGGQKGFRSRDGNPCFFIIVTIMFVFCRTVFLLFSDYISVVPYYYYMLH